MKIILTGAKGQLGQSLIHHPELPGEWELIETDYDSLDITDLQTVEQSINHHKPIALINCAAYTAVDRAEIEKESAFSINAIGPENLAKACKKANVFLIHISTDYVFPGTSSKPYREEDATGPVSTYGESKLAGEKAVALHHKNSVVIRTSWLYSEFGSNFVKTMMRLGNERSSLNVVSDQTGSPTYAGDLAMAIILLVRRHLELPTPLQASELIHFCNTGSGSWFDLARAVMELSHLSCVVNPITTEEYPLPAARPYYSILETHKFRSTIWAGLPYWRDSLKKCIENLSKEKS